jgi:hypothetical protein
MRTEQPVEQVLQDDGGGLGKIERHVTADRQGEAEGPRDVVGAT